MYSELLHIYGQTEAKFLTDGLSDVSILGTLDKGSSKVIHPHNYCTYKVKQKPLFDGWYVQCTHIGYIGHTCIGSNKSHFLKTWFLVY